MSCDEKTVELMRLEEKKAYSMSLVSFATKKQPKRYLVMPLAFSKVNFSKMEVTSRVKNILNYRKSSKALAVLIVVALLGVSTACSLNAKADKDEVKSEAEETSVTTAKVVDSDITDETTESKKKNIPDTNYAIYVYTGVTDFDYDVFADNVIDTLNQSGYQDVKFVESESSKHEGSTTEYVLDSYGNDTNIYMQVINFDSAEDALAMFAQMSDGFDDTYDLTVDSVMDGSDTFGAQIRWNDNIMKCATCSLRGNSIVFTWYTYSRELTENESDFDTMIDGFNTYIQILDDNQILFDKNIVYENL